MTRNMTVSFSQFQPNKETKQSAMTGCQPLKPEAITPKECTDKPALKPLEKDTFEHSNFSENKVVESSDKSKTSFGVKERFKFSKLLHSVFNKNNK